MPKMIVTADKLPYGKIAYRKGAEVDIEDRHVELFLKIGKTQWPEGALPNASDLPVEIMSRASKREPITEVEEPDKVVKNPTEDERKKPKKDDAVEVEAVKEDEAPKSATYQRRDMVAETPKYPMKSGRRGRPRKS